MTRVILAMTVVALLAPGARNAAAHEIGTTRVAVQVDERNTFAIEIVTDAAALADKLEAAGGRTLPADAPPARLQALIARGQQTFLERVHLRFDGGDVRPSFAVSVTPAADAFSAPAAIVRLTGVVPQTATALSWQYGWTFSSYSLSVASVADRAGAVGEAADAIWLEGDDPSPSLALDGIVPHPGRLAIAGRYLVLGFTHIVPLGVDHVLFVLGLYLLSRRTKALLWQISAFTLAHSITLGLGMFGLISVPSRIVEPLIAASIAYVAIENLFLSELRSWRLALVFGFGLLHGLGFAGALHELGLPRAEFLTALVTFNAGVEAGQLAVIAAATLLVGWHCRQQQWYRSRVVVPASVLIACTALYWTVERLSP